MGGGLKEAIPRQVVKRRLKLEKDWDGVGKMRMGQGVAGGR